MATQSQRDIQLLFIGQAATKTTGDISSMNSGEIGIFTPGGVRLTEATAATAERFIIVKKTPGTGGIPLVSGVIDKANIKSAVRTTYVASADQVTNVGYNGTNGSITVANDNRYNMRFNIRQGRVSNLGGLYIKHAFYVSDTSATQLEIASNLVKAAIAEFSKEPDKIVKVEMLSDDAGAALGAGTLTVVNGSKYVTASSASHGALPGNVLRIGGTATTDPVYVVESVSSTQIKLAVPYQGTSGAAIAGENITTLTGAFGIKVTGVAQPHKVGKLAQDLSPLIFDITLENFGATTFANTASTAGNGTEKQVKELEFFLQGNEGDYLRMGEPNTFPQRVEATGNYHIINIETEEIYTDSITAGPIRKGFVICLPTTVPNYAVTGTADDITDVLEVLAFGSANGNLAVS